ncbi:CRISPR-associated endonuclease Cas1 [Micropruina sp.]|uniref:CRISPR-associated endonuclease Cas1 n=1 Tax=Micropruina sp. TaxID=2737536 RepID=UPI0039E2B215
MDLFHDGLGIIGKCDTVKVDGDTVDLIEFKSSPLRRLAEVTDAQRVQLALQRLCLERTGLAVRSQAVYFTTQRRTVPVDLAEADFTEAIDFVRRTRALVELRTPPASLVDDRRCGSCSHVSVCLPDESREKHTARRIGVRDPNGEVLHVTHPGARVALRGGRAVVTALGEEIGSVPIERVDALVLYGNVDVSSALIRELMFHRKQVLWTSWTGRLIGYARSAWSPNGQARVEQHTASREGRLDLARELIASKIANQATQLRRNARGDGAAAAGKIRALAGECRTARDVQQIFGLEGDAAALYFGRFDQLIASPQGDWCRSTWPGRQGRGAGDPLNVALNYVYGVLLGEVIRGVVAAGLDPHAGFVHSSGRNKPALALDLMEQFRPVIADSVVISAVNNGEFAATMVTTVLGGTRLRDTGRRALLAAFERRIRTEFTHPTYGYKITWRRAVEVQARMILGVLDRSCDRYIGVRVR